MKLTSKKVRILYFLYTKTVTPGTLVDIAKQIEGGGGWQDDTYRFLQDLVRMDIIMSYQETNKFFGIFNGEKEVGGKRYPTYNINKDRLRSVWMRLDEFRLSKKILEDTALVLE